MRKFKVFVVVLSFLSIFTACNNEEDVASLPVNNETLEGIGDEILDFATETDFFMTVNTDNSAIKTRTDTDFESLYDEYMAAVNVADEYYVSLEKYEEFKKIFPNLYFPEYKDDYSFFLPVRDENIAKFLNKEGNVRIGGQIINYIDIHTHKDLLALGRLCSDETLTLTRANQIYGPYLNSIPNVYHPTDNDRKMWANVRVGKKGNVPATFVVVCFRKKGPAGKWRQYTSEATMMGIFQYASGETLICNSSNVKRGYGEVSFDIPAKSMNPYPCKANNVTILYQGINGVEFRLNVDTSKLGK